jgi:hypothetical protein
MHKPIVFLITSVLVLLAGWYYYTTEVLSNDERSAPITVGGVPDAGDGLSGATAVDAHAPLEFSWVMAESSYDETNSKPRTTVALKVPCRAGTSGCAHSVRLISVGTFDGLCSVIEKPESKNELSAVLCWFAGAGDEIGVFEENGTLVLKRGEIGEPTSESDGFRGNFTVIAPITQ